MAVGTVAIRVDSREALARLSSAFGQMPRAVERATARALRKLATWLKRQVLRAAAEASEIPQKWFSKAMRYYVAVTDQGLSVWVGTSEIKAHRLGKTVWNRRMKGARVGRKAYPKTWSWGRGKTGAAVMYRVGSERLPIAVETVAIHQRVLARLQALQAEAATRFDRLLTQELNYALTVEAAK